MAAAGATTTTTTAAADWPYKNVTLMRPLVGRVRTPSIPLPDPTHTYGARVQKDNDTAATCTYVHIYTLESGRINRQSDPSAQ